MNLSREKLITLSIAVAVFFISLGFTAYNIKGDDLFKSTASEITGFGAALANKK